MSDATDSNEKKRFLSKDLGIDCDSARYQSYLAYVLSMLFVYPVGIPLFYFVLLFMRRETLRDNAAMDRELTNDFPTVGHLVFLFEAYKPEYYFFEVRGPLSFI